MITLIHLSDIHFLQRDHLSQFDLDQQVRRALIEDLEKKPAAADYDGLLITGDIAFAGKHEEYNTAQKWLDEVFSRCNIKASSTYVVPGNHDVDRSYVDPAFPLWDSHVRLREANDPVVWRDVLDKQLHKDPLHAMLAPLTAYNDFAQRYGCKTEPEKLVWQRSFEKTLDDGRQLRFHGINSALISDAGDAPGKLLVTEFQTSHLTNDPSTVNVVLCHHPPEWLMDKATVRAALRSFSPLCLFGHEHSTRITADVHQVQLFAGAVQPSRDPNWLPTYHILQIGVKKDVARNSLEIRIHTREFDKNRFQFRPLLTENDTFGEEHSIELPKWQDAWVSKNSATKVVACNSGPTNSEKTMHSDVPCHPVSSEVAQHELMVNFFRLKTPDRYAAATEANLIRDGDDALHPQVMWSEVFRRAIEENKLAQFWAAVAARTPELQNVPNPFNS